MIPKIRRILYATDLSAGSIYAFRYAVNSAEHHDAKIVMLHVLEKLSSTAKAIIANTLYEEQAKKLADEKLAGAKNLIVEGLKNFRDKELQDNPEAIKRVESIEVVEGYPAEEILKKADELNCDIVIMGTHGKGIISHTFLGSVAERVLRRIRKPVFIIPLPRGEANINIPEM
jgi:nucleotide-binding universal stress UspA family protein